MKKKYYGRLQIFVVDNGCELKQHNDTFLHVFHNRNTGGSGGFQRGLEEIRKNSSTFSHVIFMDDDVEFDIEAFYILFDYLSKVSESILIIRSQDVCFVWTGRIFNIRLQKYGMEVI